jgi:hydroxypyruvate reductase
MAAELDNLWPDVAMQGVVVTRYAHSVPCRKIEILEAGHPVPDDNSVIAARRILEAVQGLGPEDTVIALISGGGSALMVAPVDGVTLSEKQLLNKKLLKSGATIHEMNVV